MYKVVSTPPVGQITAADALAKVKAGKGMLVSIYTPSGVTYPESSPFSSGKHASVLRRLHNREGWDFGWVRLNHMTYTPSTCRKSPEEVLERTLAEPTEEVYYFETLAEFAQAVLENGWK